MKNGAKGDLYPPVLPIWGSMLPASPPSDYGDISFDPDRPLGKKRRATKLSDLDREALALLPEIFPSSKR